MGFDVATLRDTIARHGPVTRVVIADLRGSSPREVGAAMLVWEDGQSGTIGGGALEFEAATAARAGQTGISRHALGPDLGQCCGGAVVVLSERYDALRASGLNDPVIVRPVDEGTGTPPLSVQRLLAQARGQGVAPAAQLLEGWMIEPVHVPPRQLWVWGAGHVGRAIVDVIAPMPDFAITWIDTARDRFPSEVPDGVDILTAPDPAPLAAYAPQEGEHLILTYSHALDLALCHAILMRGSRFAGLIGSATKWARFRKRLAALGHSAHAINQITCPIGAPGLGKHPQAIAIGVSAELLAQEAKQVSQNKNDLNQTNRNRGVRA